jgi:transposase InsO family protein
MGHTGGESVRRLPHIAQGFTLNSDAAMTRCESCIIGKHPRQAHPSSQSPPASRFLELIHSDVCGPIPVVTLHHKCYFIIFLDDHTGLLALQLLVTKDQALEAWQSVRAKWETRSGLPVVAFRSDNGGEFLNEVFAADLKAAGIKHQLSTPYAHQQNGRAEHVLRTIEGRMYAMLNHAWLPRNLWGEAALTAAYLFNHTESRALPAGKTPYEMLHKVKPDLSHIRMFGARCFTRIPSELQQKLGPKSCEAIFMGYAPGVVVTR